MERELYQHATDIFLKLYGNVATKLSKERQQGIYSHEEFYDLNVKLIECISNTIYRKNKHSGRFQFYLKTKLIKEFENYNRDTIDYLCDSFQQYADDFCDKKKIPKIKISISPLTKINPSSLGKKEIIIDRSQSSYNKRDFLENTLDHELRHHLLISKHGLIKKLRIGYPISFMTSLLILAAGGILQNKPLYTLGSVYWTVNWGVEMHADLPRKKYLLGEVFFASLPWIVKFIFNL